MDAAKFYKSTLFLWVTLATFLIVYFIAAFPYYSGDVKNHVVWAGSLLSQGASGFYGREFKDFAFPNYPPLTMGLFALSLRFYQLTSHAVLLLNQIPPFPSRLVFVFQDEHMKIAFLKLPAIVAKSVIITVVLFYLSYIPFHSFSLWFAPSLYQLNFSLVSHSVGKNAFNFWELLFNFKSVPDNQGFLRVSYQMWGYLLFVLAFIPAGALLLKRKLTLKRLLVLLLYISLTDFFFLTRMHERYLAPAIVFSIAGAVFDRRMWILVGPLSLIFLLNLYHGLYQPSIPLFDTLVKSFLFLRIMVVGLALAIG